jgi:hypothetical protein
VPTLETRLEDGKSAMWCATMPLAWQKFEADVAKGPVDLQGIEKVCRDLRNAPDPGLDPSNYYTAAGLYKDGILERIRSELPAKFPEAPLPDERFSRAVGALAYAYLRVEMPFEHTFEDCPDPFTFHHRDGKDTSVRAFGIPAPKSSTESANIREQVKLLFRQRSEFAVDLSKNTKPYQTILARIDRQETLRDTLKELDARISQADKKLLPTNLPDTAILLIPTMNWRVKHDFPEFRSRGFSTRAVPDAFVDQAEQSIEFKISRKGVIIKSRAYDPALIANGHEPGPNEFKFERPYLIVLKRRDGKEPFFVMWVENAELMQLHKGR